MEGRSLVVVHQRTAPRRRRARAENDLATRLTASTNPIRISAAPHAWACLTGSGLSEYLKIVTGMLLTACDGSVTTMSGAIAHTNSSGAVSPAARATARRAPLIMPLSAVGIVTDRVVRQRLAPSAKPASLTALGTRVRTSWHDR